MSETPSETPPSSQEPLLSRAEYILFQRELMQHFFDTGIIPAERHLDWVDEDYSPLFEEVIREDPELVTLIRGDRAGAIEEIARRILDRKSARAA